MLNNLHWKKIIVGITASLAVSSLIVGLRSQGSFEQIELLAYDVLVRLNAKSDSDERIVIVGIDDNSLQQLKSDKVSDRVLQQVLETITAYEPKVIGVDIIRDIPIGEGREEFINYVNNIYQPLDGSIKPIIFPCALPSENKPNGIAPPPILDPDSAVGFVDLETDPQNIFGGELIRRTFISSIPVDTGSENKITKTFDAGATNYLCNAPFSFGFLTALSYIQAEQAEDLIPGLVPNIEDIIDLSKITAGEITVQSFTFTPLDRTTGSYRQLDTGVYQHLIDYQYTQPGTIIPLTKVLQKEVTAQQFQNKVVLIGYITKEDIHQTPFGLRPGVFIHGWIVSQILRHVLDEEPSIWTWSEPVEWLWIIGWGVAGSIVALAIRSVGIFVVVQGIAIAILVGSCWLLFTQQGWITLIPPALSFAIASIAVKAIASKFPILPSTNYSRREQETIPTMEINPLVSVVEQLIENTPSSEREALRTVVEQLIENTPPSERKPLQTVVEGLPSSTSSRERKPLETVVEQLINNTPEAQREPLMTVVEELINNTPTVQREPLETVVERLTNPSGRRSFVRKDPFIDRRLGYGDRYILQKLLGKGGMSKVYVALDTKLNNKKVAIKIMTSYFSTNNQHLIKRFMGEVKSLSILTHPNIIQITDYGKTPQQQPFSGYPFYVMEYFEGKTLQQLLNENHKLAPNSALTIILKVCQGLKEAHHKGIIHRDLKPDNIFLISEGDIVKLIDFGIAKKIDEESKKQTQLTVAGTFLGTYRYASPEQCLGESIDSRTDIYSLGMVLYEILSGNNPYNLKEDSDTTNADWSVAHRREMPIPLRQQPNCHNLSVELEHIVMKCLEKLPQNRFQTIEQLEKPLRNCL